LQFIHIFINLISMQFDSQHKKRLVQEASTFNRDAR